MKKFSNIEKIDLNDNEPKTFNESLKALVSDVLTVKITGDAELAGKVELTIEGKETLIDIVEKLTNVHILKERVKLLESFKAKAFKTPTLNWVDDEIKKVNESIEKFISGELKDTIDIQADESVINEGKKKVEWSGKFFEDNEKDSDEFLKSFQYFVDTYINGGFSQLEKMLKSIIKDGKLGNLKDYLNGCECSDAEKIKDWVLDNI